jgi:predicted ATPase
MRLYRGSPKPTKRSNKAKSVGSRPKFNRLNGELTGMLRGDASKVESAYVESLRIAREQEAKSWELRAAMSMARLWLKQGKRQQAHDLLSPIYDWFTEGFETRDLREAKTLLGELT